MTDVPSTPAYPTTAYPTPSTRPGVSGLAIGALAIGGIIAFLHLTVRLLDAILGNNTAITNSPFALVMGILGLLSIIPIAGAIVLGHLALARTRAGKSRGRGAAWVATVMGYALLVLYFNRLIVAIIATIVYKDGRFVEDFFWWA